MEIFNGILGITYPELMDGIISDGALQKLCQRGRVVRLRRACREMPALYAVDSFPNRFLTLIYHRTPDLKAQAESKEFTEIIEIDGVAAKFYADVILDGVRHLPLDKQTLYTNNASIMAAFRLKLMRGDSQRGKVGKGKLKRGEFWAKAARALPRIADRYPHSLPENPRALQRRFNEFYAGGQPNYGVFVSGKFSNNNAASIATRDQIAVLIKIMSYGANPNNEEVARIYNQIAQVAGWKTITASAIRLWKEKYGLEIAAARLGKNEFYNRRCMQVKRFKPTAPLYFWSLDGWDIELYYQARVKNRITYCNRLTVVIVLDAFNNYPIGFAVGDRENTDLITAALRNAVNHTAELFGQRYRSNQIQCDHYGIKKMTPTYRVVGDKLTPARVGNAKSKPIERYFGQINNKYCKWLRNWSGYGITSRRELQPNSDWLNANRHRFPTLEECVAQMASIIAVERGTKREAFVAGWANVAPERMLPLTTEQYLLTFGEQTGYKNALEGSGLNVRLLGARRTYDCFDINFRKYSHVRWSVRFDPDNMEEVLAVNDDGSLQFLLKEKYMQPMALADRREGDAEELERVFAYNRELEKYVIDTQTEATKIVDEYFTGHPEIANSLQKHLLVDNRGQHKDRRNDRRLAEAAHVVDTAFEEVGEDKAPSTFDFY